MLHLCIAQKIAKKFNFSINYVKGSILPDLTKTLEGETRTKTHYITEYENGVLDVPNLEEFLKQNNLDSEEKLGIYSHLIEDKIYFENFVSSYIEIIDNDKQKIKFKFDEKIRDFEGYQKIFYSDFKRLNYYLIKKYELNITKIRDELLDTIENEKLKEILKMYIREYEYENIQPIIFDENEADKYIETCYEEIVKKIKNYI